MTEQQLLDKGYRKYSGEEVDVFFNLDICIHSGVCTRGLPTVFDIKKKPWVNADGEAGEVIAERIRKCPSGALQYILKDGVDIKREENRVVAIKNNLEVGEVTFTKAGDTMIIIDHTHVDDSLRGQNLGSKMVHEVINYARENELSVIPLCPFAKHEFEVNEAYQSVLKK